MSHNFPARHSGADLDSPQARVFIQDVRLTVDVNLVHHQVRTAKRLQRGKRLKAFPCALRRGTVSKHAHVVSISSAVAQLRVVTVHGRLEAHSFIRLSVN